MILLNERDRISLDLVRASQEVTTDLYYELDIQIWWNPPQYLI